MMTMIVALLGLLFSKYQSGFFLVKLKLWIFAQRWQKPNWGFDVEAFTSQKTVSCHAVNCG